MNTHFFTFIHKKASISFLLRHTYVTLIILTTNFLGKPRKYKTYKTRKCFYASLFRDVIK